jgi:hypothetical protein
VLCGHPYSDCKARTWDEAGTVDVTVMREEVARLNALREVERELRNAYGDVADVWPHFAALRAALSEHPDE